MCCLVLGWRADRMTRSGWTLVISLFDLIMALINEVRSKVVSVRKSTVTTFPLTFHSGTAKSSSTTSSILEMSSRNSSSSSVSRYAASWGDAPLVCPVCSSVVSSSSSSCSAFSSSYRFISSVSRSARFFAARTMRIILLSVMLLGCAEIGHAVDIEGHLLGLNILGIGFGFSAGHNGESVKAHVVRLVHVQLQGNDIA